MWKKYLMCTIFLITLAACGSSDSDRQAMVWIYMTDIGNNSLDVFPIDGTGDIAPTRSIQGTTTTFNGPIRVAVNAGWIYVVDVFNDSLDVFPIDGTGDIAPTRSIQGDATTFNSPVGVAVGAGAGS